MFFFFPADSVVRLFTNVIPRAARMKRHTSVRIMKIEMNSGAQMCKSLRSHQLWWIPGDFKCVTSSVRRMYSVHRPSILRGGDATGNCRRIFDQNKSCSKSYLNPKLIYRKSATLKCWRLTVKKHIKTVKKVVFCIVWRHTVCKPNVVQH